MQTVESPNYDIDIKNDVDYYCLYKTNRSEIGYVYYLFVIDKINKNGFVCDFASNGTIMPISRHIFFDNSKFSISCYTNTPYSLEDLGRIWKSFVVDSHFKRCHSYALDFKHLDPLLKKFFTEKKAHLTAV